jgi:hypothetical protein
MHLAHLSFHHLPCMLVHLTLRTLSFLLESISINQHLVGVEATIEAEIEVDSTITLLTNLNARYASNEDTQQSSVIVDLI